MPGWSWWVIFAGILVLAALVLGGLALGLWRRVKVLLRDLDRLSALATSVGETFGGLGEGSNHASLPRPTRHGS